LAKLRPLRCGRARFAVQETTSGVQPTTPRCNLQYFRGVTLHSCRHHALDRRACFGCHLVEDRESQVRDDLLHFRNPLRTVLNYKRLRGMAYWTDIRDWLGGWPMDFAGNQETVTFCEGIDLQLVRMKTGEGNTEYLFTRKKS
jgi:hypothetical protein